MDQAGDDADLGITTLADGDVITVVISGEIDVSNAAQLSIAALSALNEGPHELIIDLTAVTFMDSSGLGHLARVLRASRPTPVQLLVLVHHPRVIRLFEVTGVMGAFRVQQVP